MPASTFTTYSLPSSSTQSVQTEKQTAASSGVPISENLSTVANSSFEITKWLESLPAETTYNAEYFAKLRETYASNPGAVPWPEGSAKTQANLRNNGHWILILLHYLFICECICVCSAEGKRLQFIVWRFFIILYGDAHRRDYTIRIQNLHQSHSYLRIRPSIQRHHRLQWVRQEQHPRRHSIFARKHQQINAASQVKPNRTHIQGRMLRHRESFGLDKI